MNKLAMYNFRPEDLKNFKARNLYSAQMGERLVHLAKLPSAKLMSIFRREKLIAVLCLNVSWPGVADCFAVTSDEIKRTPVAFHKLVLRLLASFSRDLGIHRLQCAVNSEFVDGQRWAESMGFVKEGLMREFSYDRKDHYLYARVQ